MKKVNKIMTFMLVIAMIITILPTNVFAIVGSYTVSVGAKSIKVGSSTKLTIACTKAAGKFTITSSNPSVVSVNRASTWVDNKVMDNTITIKGVSKGTATITITPTDVSDTEYNLITSKKTITITVTEATSTNNNNNSSSSNNNTTTTPKSSDATLKSISLETGKVDFNKNVTKYTVNVDKTVTSLGLKAVPTDSKATVKITGDGNFKTGNNIVNITVTAEDGTTKVYQITVVKSKIGSGPLIDLKVKDHYLDRDFDPSETKYTVNVVDMTEVELEYVLTNPNSKVEITGTKNLKEGMNKVKLTVTEPSGRVTIYTIDVINTIIAKNNNSIWIIIIIILLILLICETMYIIANRKKEEKPVKETKPSEKAPVKRTGAKPKAKSKVASTKTTAKRKSSRGKASGTTKKTK